MQENIRSTNENIEIVKGIYRNFVSGNMQAVLDALAEDVDWDGRINWPGGPLDRPYEGPRHGRAGVAAAFETFLGIVQYECGLVPNSYTIMGNNVLVIGQDIRRDVITGERTENRWSMYWTIEGGKVTRVRVYQDTVELLEPE